ncbi:MAG: bifunctional aminodeoxychorismate synthase component I/aminotransferase [Variovorax sp.]|nr:bifunctional aminodeoxychorismate synthase component I/aminotransferase [Variovorax sp.]
MMRGAPAPSGAEALGVLASGVSALIDFSDPHDPAAPRLRQAFGVARQVLAAHRPQDVRPVLDAVQAAAQQGRWCVGYLRYEAAAAFDAALAVHAPEGPLAWFAVFDEALPWPAAADVSAPPVEVRWHEAMQRSAFDDALAGIQRDIAAGEYYQVNFTGQMVGALRSARHDATLALFAALQRAQPGGYAAYIDTARAGAGGSTGDGPTQGEHILSVSPELFFDWRAGSLLARPMKGTAARGATAQSDAAQAEALRASPKERAENVMIVDLLRNDLSRIALPHSVRVPRLFHCEALPTVWQMTSDVAARTRPGCTLAEVFAALFPCGSVTGAPKVRAMQAIRTLEGAPRGVYCGAVGIVRPGGAATFNVPIRTLTLHGAAVRCGVGSGITAGASAEGEWREWGHKQAFVQRASAPFELLETLRIEDGHWRSADAHLARMAQAARHFGYGWDAGHVEGVLLRLARQHPCGAWRVRLLLDARGRAQAEAHALPASPAQVRLRLADRPLDEAHGEFVRFKTTRRAHYDAFAPTRPDIFDTLLWNAEGEVTECTRGNVALWLGGRWVTPALHCGLLPGVGRARALAEGRVGEAVVRVEDVPRARALAFVNSLRGWIEAVLDAPAA